VFLLVIQLETLSYNVTLSSPDLFFGVVAFRLDGRLSFADTLLGEFAVSKADLLADRTLSLVW